MQLIQYCHVSLFSTVITNEFIGEEFCLSPNSLDGYEATGFDVTQLAQDEEQKLFTLKTNMPIPMLVHGDSFQWEKYGHHILLSSPDLNSNNKGSLHWTFWNSLIEFLHTDLDGNLSSTLNPYTASKIKITWGSGRNCKQRQNMFDQQMLHQKCKHQFLEDIGDIALSATQIPYSYSHIYSTRGLKSIQCWNQCLKYYSRSTFKLSQNHMNFLFILISFHLHVTVYQMWPACYSCWFNRRNSIPCTRCNIISQEHDSIPWRPKWQRINVDATSFHLLWQLCTIIKIFSIRRFKLDGGFQNLSKTNIIWTSYVLWDC